MYGIIYLTINKINNKAYIGQHRTNSLNFDGYLGSGKVLNRAINKYGKDNFLRIVIDCANTENQLNKLEKMYIEYFDAVKDKEFYNIHIGGSGGDTYTGRTEKEKAIYRKKMQKLTKGENNGMYGKNHTEEAKRNMSKNHNREAYSTKEFIDKMKEVTKGENNGMYNKQHSQESKDKISENRKGKTLGNKNGMYGKRGAESINGVHYRCYDDNKTLIKEFVSFSEVKEWLNINHHSSLLLAIKKKRKYKGYYWEKDERIKKV